MLLAGDEMGRTQGGNNNAYCQDNETSWVHWDLDDAQRELLAFTRRAIASRQEQPVLHRRTFFQGRPLRGAGVKDLIWFEPSGREMTDQAWDSGFARCLGALLRGDAIDELNEQGDVTRGDTLLLLLNAHHGPKAFRLPDLPPNQRWDLVLDTTDVAHSRLRQYGKHYRLQTRSLALLRQTARHSKGKG